MSRPPLEVADVVRQHSDVFLQRYGHTLSGAQHRALRAIALCRTAALGGHITQCDDCGHEVQAYKSVVAGGIVLNQLQAGTAIGKAASEHLATLDYPIFTAHLHLYVAYREAAATGQSVLEYDRHSKAAAEFIAFFTEVLEVIPHA